VGDMEGGVPLLPPIVYDGVRYDGREVEFDRAVLIDCRCRDDGDQHLSKEPLPTCWCTKLLERISS
jgi:hypothetical protein